MTEDEDSAFALPPAVGVSCILRRIKGGLNRLGLIRIEGEIHSIKPYPSGHVYRRGGGRHYFERSVERVCGF